jgi:ribosomal protein L39E
MHGVKVKKIKGHMLKKEKKNRPRPKYVKMKEEQKEANRSFLAQGI